ncbi:MAG TPA: crosslink repair DNA glycosylase YcaQ family protein [Streptosporangiaceae bacterium]
MADQLELSLTQARRLAVRAQYLAGPREPQAGDGIDGMRQVLRGLRVLQIDPVNVVARSHLLVLWSRLGPFDRDDLDTLLWRERWLFEYWAHAASIVLTEDYPIHRDRMRDWRVGVERPRRNWMAANQDFRRYVLDRLRDAGPLPGEALEDRAAVSWVSTGWTHGRNVERMLDTLWQQGVITVAGRDGLRRLWGLAEFPEAEDLPQHEVVTRAAEHALRALGVARARDVERHFTIGRYPGLDLERVSWARPVRLEGGSEQWWVHRDRLGLLDEDWQPRTTLLSPFDNLICDRDRTERLWGFVFRNEMYVPKHKRQFGHYVMPVLSGERLIGRAAPRLDRRRGVLAIEGLFAEDGFGAQMLAGGAPPPGGPVATAIESLAAFGGAGAVSYPGEAVGVS